MPEEEIKKLIRRIKASKLRLLKKSPFYGLLSMQVKSSLANSDELIDTDGESLFFGAESLSKLNALSPEEFDYLLLHTLLHMVLRHPERSKGKVNPAVYSLACDLAVNSFIYTSREDKNAPFTYQGKEIAHLLPDGKEASEKTADEIYGVLIKALAETNSSNPEGQGNSGNNSDDGKGNGKDSSSQENKDRGSKNSRGQEGEDDGSDSLEPGPDSHARWKDASRGKGESFADKVMQAMTAAKARGTLSLGEERLLGQYMAPEIDWHEVLRDFLSFDEYDYTFLPPDRRFDDAPFYLPGYNIDLASEVKDVLFLIDTSGSMSDKVIGEVFASIKDALNQFDGKIKGKLAFFDAKLFPIHDFSSIEDLNKIRAVGGGGTSFRAALKEARERLRDEPVKAIIFLTDGYAEEVSPDDFPDTPILWLVTTIDAPKQKVGRTIRIHVDE